MKRIKSKREKGSKIVNGTLEWNWEENGVQKKFRGSWLLPLEIGEYKDCWKTLPGCKNNIKGE